MISYLQERIRPSEILRLVLLVVIIAGTAWIFKSKAITPDVVDLRAKSSGLDKRLGFNQGQINQLSEAGDLSFLRSQIEDLENTMTLRGITLEATGEDEEKESFQASNLEETTTKINEAVERAAIFIRSSTPTGEQDGRETRLIEGDGDFNAVIRALSGLDALNVSVTEINLTRISNSTGLKIRLSLAF